MNRITIIGRLTADPELRNTTNNTSVASFSVAVDRRFKTKDGAKETDFIPVVAWRQLGELCSKYLSKGKQAAVTGSLQTRIYEDKQGNKRKAFEILADEVEFLGKGNGQSESLPGIEGFADMSESDLPF